MRQYPGILSNDKAKKRTTTGQIQIIKTEEETTFYIDESDHQRTEPKSKNGVGQAQPSDYYCFSRASWNWKQQPGRFDIPLKVFIFNAALTVHVMPEC